MRLGEIASGARLNERSAVSGYGEVCQSEMRCNVYMEACSMDKRATEGNVTCTFSIKLACE